ncbi:MAG TPA: glutamyl-tRNA reductase [Herpetosiphonaceae bacterium]
MQLVVVGAHQRTAPVAIRERLAFPEQSLQPALQALRMHAAEACIISTCNRVEVYGLVDQADPGRALRSFLAQWHGLDEDELTPHLYTFCGADAARHLLRTAAGLDSMALGEDQIMAQLKAALGQAQAAAALGPLLQRLLASALATGKQVRAQTGIARAQLSVVSVALQLARQTLGGLDGQRVLVVGAGRTAELALKHLKSERLAGLQLVSRTLERTQALAERFGAAAWPLDELPAALSRADVVIACTSAETLVIEAAQVQAAAAGRSTPLLLLDLAVPRDIDRQVAALPGVRLFDVDDMQAVSAANRAARAAEIGAAEAIVNKETDKFMAWWSSQEVLPTIRALREHAEAIRAAELQRALARLPELSEEAQATVAALTSAIINKLLHHPITTLKAPESDAQLAQAAQQLFQLQQPARNTHVKPEP